MENTPYFTEMIYSGAVMIACYIIMVIFAHNVQKQILNGNPDIKLLILAPIIGIAIWISKIILVILIIINLYHYFNNN